jgi:hypothetical protein
MFDHNCGAAAGTRTSNVWHQKGTPGLTKLVLEDPSMPHELIRSCSCRLFIVFGSFPASEKGKKGPIVL